MKLPNAAAARVSREKIVDYLLNRAHPDNGGKAEFFSQLGFHPDRWEGLAAVLKKLAATGTVASATRSAHGEKFVVVGKIAAPGGRMPLVQSIWIVDKGQAAARLVTAYPRKN